MQVQTPHTVHVQDVMIPHMLRDDLCSYRLVQTPHTVHLQNVMIPHVLWDDLCSYMLVQSPHTVHVQDVVIPHVLWDDLLPKRLGPIAEFEDDFLTTGAATPGRGVKAISLDSHMVRLY